MFCGETIVPQGLTGLQLSFYFTVRGYGYGGKDHGRNEKFIRRTLSFISEVNKEFLLSFDEEMEKLAILLNDRD